MRVAGRIKHMAKNLYRNTGTLTVCMAALGLLLTACGASAGGAGENGWEASDTGKAPGGDGIGPIFRSSPSAPDTIPTSVGPPEQPMSPPRANAVSQWASTFAEKGLGISKTAGDLAGPMAFAILMGSARLFYGKYGDRIHLERFM